LLESDGIAPFRLLQSLQWREVGFFVLAPSSVIRDYYDRILVREWESIALMPGDPHQVFVICVVGKTPTDSTGNFQAPLIINYKTMIGRQVILSEVGMSVRQPLV
jgi:flagellar assembly factor FliW